MTPPALTPPRLTPLPPGPVLAISSLADMDILFNISATGQENIKKLMDLEILEQAHIAWDNIEEALLTNPREKIFMLVVRLQHSRICF
jgi:hypothetical protein